jgi:pimeloyl-ACP methyl ester carboxylesterase
VIRLLALVVALLATAPATAHAAIAWHPCSGAAALDCARVAAPLDWDEPDGATLSLAVIRHRASDPARRLGTLFVNPGGPGESGVSLLRGGAGDGLDAWGDGRFDVVSWDPRGVGASAPVRCFRSAAAERRFWVSARIPTTRAASRRFSARATDLARRCGQVSGQLLAHITTADTARDLDHLRALVGDDQLTYAGLSYGSMLGQTYANLFPDHVRAMLLDGIVDAVAYSAGAEARVANGVSAADAVFAHFRTVTGAPALTPLLARTPIGDLTAGDLLLSQFAPLRDPALWPSDAADLQAAARGNGSKLEAAARPARSPTAWAGATTSAAIACADAPAHQPASAWPQVIGHLQRVSHLQGLVQGWWLWAPCASWPIRGQDAYRGPWNARTPNPILLIGTRHDPSTPYANAVRAAHLLGNAVLLTHDGDGHISYTDPSACIERWRTAYLVHLRTPPSGTVCHADRLAGRA